MPTSDHELASALAHQTGRLLAHLQHHRRRVPPELFGRIVDRRAHRFLADALRRHRPSDAVLSEEAVDDLSRLRARRVWIIDPLDGTREFREGRPDWAVHVALWADGSLRAGAIAVPGRGVTLSTAGDLAGPVPSRPSGPIIAVSRSRPAAEAEPVAAALGARLLRMGSAGAKTAAVVLGEADAYVHSGGQHEWDSAAPVAVASAGGFHASRLDGSPLRYNQPSHWLPDLLICRPELADEILAATGRNEPSRRPLLATSVPGEPA